LADGEPALVANIAGWNFVKNQTLTEFASVWFLIEQQAGMRSPQTTRAGPAFR
jgi:hypothetical protein